MAPSAPLHLAVALDGAGWHPAAWRQPGARPAELLTPGYWIDLIRRAEGGRLDFVTLEDSLSMQSSRADGNDGRTDQVRGRLDAALVAARVAPTTSHIGLIPTVTVTHTEPFHISKAIATLDYVSRGRAGVGIQVSDRAHEAGQFGRRTFPEGQARLDDLFEEAGDYVEVLRRLWDSWEDDAEIRDVATGRFIDRNKLHYIDFEGRHFRVKGPSITPRPPQGQPVVTALATSTEACRFAAENTDVVFITAADVDTASRLVADVAEEGQKSGRPTGQPRVFADLLVFLDRTAAAAAERKRRLDDLDGAEYRSDAPIFTGTIDQLADLLTVWREVGLNGYRLRPAAIPHDLDAITGALVPELQERGLCPHALEPEMLRGRLGLARPTNRYASI